MNHEVIGRGMGMEMGIGMGIGKEKGFVVYLNWNMAVGGR